MLTYQDYQDYFQGQEDPLNQAFQVMDRISLPWGRDIHWPDDISSLAIQALKSGYRAMVFDKDRFISQLADRDRALVLLYCLGGLRHFYQQAGICEDILYASLSDLSLRLKLYDSRHHDLGLTPDDGHWLLRNYFLKIFKLGSLQFERIRLDFDLLPFDLTWDDPAWLDRLQGQELLSVHIMAGSDISPQASLAALDQARDFFAGEAFEYFYCLSWLLNPHNPHLLDPSSRILAFSKLFHQVAWTDFSDWMIFSVFQGDLHRPAQTTLQQRIQKDPGKLGMGLGLIPINERSPLWEKSN